MRPYEQDNIHVQDNIDMQDNILMHDDIHVRKSIDHYLIKRSPLQMI